MEETQAPPPAYNTLVREPEEAGEIAAAPADPENVGEDAGVRPVAGGETTAQPAVREDLFLITIFVVGVIVVVVSGRCKSALLVWWANVSNVSCS